MAQKILLIIFILPLVLLSGGPCFSADKPLVYFGINLRYSPRALYNRYQPLMDYLTQNTPYRFELKVSRGYREALNDLKDGRVQISSLGDGAFVEAVLLHGAIPIVRPLNRDGKPFYRCAIIVPPSSTINSVTALKGKRFAFGSHHSITGNLVPRHLLQRAGIDSQDLGSAKTLNNHETVTKAILKGQYDAGAVKDMFAVKYRKYGLRVLAYSASLPSVPLVAGKRAPKELRKAVADALLKLDSRNPAHKKILSGWDEEFAYGFSTASISDYREIFHTFQSIPYGCGTGCHR